MAQPTFPQLSDLKPGDRLVADSGFPCLREGEVVVVESLCDELYVHCAAGSHDLEGQGGPAGECVGFSLAPVAVADIMGAAGYRTFPTGGGCMAWARDLEDGSRIWICTDDNDTDGAPDEAIWLVGRHDLDGGFIVANGSYTLARAFEIAPLIPSPAGKDETMSFPAVAEAAISKAEARGIDNPERVAAHFPRTLTDRQRDTILAALQTWQAMREGAPDEVIEVAIGGRTGDNPMLTDAEIEDLFEDILAAGTMELR